MKKLIAASSVFLLLLLSGGLWISLAQLLPAGVPRSVVLVGLGAAFVCIFVWLLISRLRRVLKGPDRLLTELLFVAFELVLLILAFASVYQRLGIMDNTAEGSPISHSFATAVYYSIVTFTTLGYGDFYPTALGRALAAMEALTGYLILGILASTGVSILSPREPPAKDEDLEEEG